MGAKIEGAWTPMIRVQGISKLHGATHAVIPDRIEAGTTWVNTHRGSLWPLQPSAGLKHSGVGAELGTWGLECFTDLSIRHDALAVQARSVGLITTGSK